MVSSTPAASPLNVVVLMPVRDDWTSAAELIRRLDQGISSYPCALNVLLVDDGSVQSYSSTDFAYDFGIVRTIRILRLSRNLGHQRAIAVGLAHVEQSTARDAVLVMDADGEDTPSGALELIHSFADNGGANAIFAERSRRVESILFRAFYWLYKSLHRILTGLSVRVGNFSILPSAYLSTIVTLPEMWNHYAAAVFRSGLPFTTIPIPRGYRIAGRSRMNFVALVTHGLSAISVFGDVVGVRLLIGSLFGSLLAAVGILVVVTVRFFTNRAIPGWATDATGMLAIILVQFITIATIFTFFMLSSRTNLGFVPSRDYTLFIAEVVDIYQRD
jgi:glycosyltransferase involved in cell wall biosynthesis